MNRSRLPWARFRDREDSEHEQALIRSVIVLFGVAYFAVFSLLDGRPSPALPVGFLSLVASAGILGWIAVSPRRNPLRRAVGIVHDNLAATAAIYLGAEIGAPWYIVYLWVAFGNGFRFGRRYLFGSAALAVACFGAIVARDPYWGGMRPLSGGLLAGLVVLPAYGALLLGRLRRAHDALRSANEALAREKERLHVTLHSMGDGVIVLDADGRVEILNRAAARLTGWTQEAGKGRDLGEVFRVSGRAGPGAVIGQECDIASPYCTAPGKQEVEGEGDVLLVEREGNERSVTCSRTRIRGPRGEPQGAVIVFRDITERIRMEEELVRSGKLESLGALAARIAHDFNNALAAILGNLQLAREHVQEEAERRLDAAERATRRARELANQLLAFSKGGSPVRQSVPAAGIVRSAVESAVRGLNVSTEYDFPDDLWPVHADPGQLSQVFRHLALNAAEAMPCGGTLRVRATGRTVARGGGATVAPGDYVEMEVSDTGKGIPRDLVSRIFDPYFTTKEKRSGLGLTAVYRILKNHGGEISVETTRGRGTTFRVLLPARPGAEVVEETPAGSVAADAAAEGTARKILVMDDEEMIREVMGEILARLGYEVGYARDGEEALQAYERAQEEGQPYDLVVMDLTIPGGMGGKEAVARLLALDPDARAVVSSGYSDDPVMANYRDHGFVGVIPKPFTLSQVERVVGRAAGKDGRKAA